MWLAYDPVVYLRRVSDCRARRILKIKLLVRLSEHGSASALLKELKYATPNVLSITAKSQGLTRYPGHHVAY